MSLGYLTISSNDPLVERDTFMCCHCGGICVIVIGSKRKRHFCQQCWAPTCVVEGGHGVEGDLRCLTHYPIEQKLADVESGKLPLTAL